MFDTARLHLRAYKESDKPFLGQLINTAEVQSTLSNDTFVPKNRAYIDEFISNLDKAMFFALIVRRITSSTEGDDGKEDLIGFVMLDMKNPRNRNGSLGVAITPKEQGKGYAKESLSFVIAHAFNELGLHRISLTVYSNNPRGKALYEKLGFVLEGTYRQALWTKGKWEDIHFMGLLEEEWLNQSGFCILSSDPSMLSANPGQSM